MFINIAIYTFIVLTAVVIFFQGCLAAGLPWGSASMGGKYPGKYPPKMRWVALFNIFILIFISLIFLSKAGFLLPEWISFAKIAIWVVVVFFFAGTIMNSITPSKIERIWAPVALLQSIASFIIALKPL